MDADVVRLTHIAHIELLGHLLVLQDRHILILGNWRLKDLPAVDQGRLVGQTTLRLHLVELRLLLLLILILLIKLRGVVSSDVHRARALALIPQLALTITCILELG